MTGKLTEFKKNGTSGQPITRKFCPTCGSRISSSAAAMPGVLMINASSLDEPEKFVKMNGREVFKFATRVMVASADKILAECGKTVDEIDVYVPHQANKRIIDYAAGKLGIPEEKVVVNVDRYGNTSSGSIPLALADARADGRLREGELVLMTGMGAGLTWGSALIEWTDDRNGDAQ